MNLINKNKIPRRFWRRFTRTKLYNYIPDKWAVKIKYRNNFLKKLDLKNPVTFNEKLQWLKLYDRKPEYTTLVDKLKAKEYVASIIGDEYIIPTLGAWESFDEIDFDSLPDKFVLKCTHSSGDVVVCKDKNKLDKEKAKKVLQKSLNTDYYLICREWPYKNVARRILCEKYISESNKKLVDYKFYCFNGKIDSVMVCVDREIGKVKYLFYDLEWNRLFYQNYEPDSIYEIDKPSNFEDMVRIVSLLSKDMSHIRVDLYNVDGRIFFSELTLYNMGGFDRDISLETDIKWGQLIELKKKD